MNNEYIKLLLRNIYGSIDDIKLRLNKYLLYRNNTLDDLMDPYEMGYAPKTVNYHDGALDFYKEIELIVGEEDIEENIFNKENNKNLFSKLI